MFTNSAIKKQSIYDFTVKSIDGKEVSLSEYEGKWQLIVNVASNCGLTPQYAGLQELYVDFKDKGLVVLGFPCNQFAGQEPGDEESIKQGCVLNYGVEFPMFAKIKVNGSDADPLYKYLKEALPGFLGNRVKWNFTKFLIDPEGKPVKRFAPRDTPDVIRQELEKLL
jgi:glutathione peroxidase